MFHSERKNRAVHLNKENIIGMGLHVLYGGIVIDNRHIFGMSCAPGYSCVDDFFDAVNYATEIAIDRLETVAD